MKKTSMTLLVMALVMAWATPSALAAGKKRGSASKEANEAADAAMYKPIEYANKDKEGPKLVVIPGEIKSNNATFEQKVTANNIADFGELELSKANFGVLERSDLGPMLDELRLAANMGNKESLSKFRKGKFATTKWLVRFDILKAEPVAAVKKRFSGGALGSVVGILGGNRGADAAGTAIGSVETSDAAGVWIIGMRYKVLDAETSEQVTTNYVEAKMEIGAKQSSVMGISSEAVGGVTLDSMVQRLVQQCVVELDGKK